MKKWIYLWHQSEYMWGNPRRALCSRMSRGVRGEKWVALDDKFIGILRKVEKLSFCVAQVDKC